MTNIPVEQSPAVESLEAEFAPVQYRVMAIDDYDAAVLLWAGTAGVRMRDSDSRIGVEKYLLRNPGLSFVAEADGSLAGTIMAGHDGRRGYIQHLSVAESRRRLGIGSQLVRLCLEALRQEGILKSHLMILVENEAGMQFWTRLGWERRADVGLYSFINGSSADT